MMRAFQLFSKEKVIISFYALVSVLIAIQRYAGGPRRYNNFTIFRQALFHLQNHQNLYLEYPREYADLFLYHPTFCILFFPFSVLPIPAGLLLWALAGSFIMFYAIKVLPVSYENKVFFWWFIIVELVVSIHGQQTNSIIAALGLFTFAFLEKDKQKWAALFPVLAFCIKGYGLIFLALFLFYPNRREYIRYTILWMTALLLLPLPVVGTGHFVQIYKDWLVCLINDHKDNFGFSIMGLVKMKWPALTDMDTMLIQLAGLVLFAVTWIKTLVEGTVRSLSNRLLLLGYISLWVIMFNHSAESPTYVIAVQGVILFYIVNRYNDSTWPKLLISFVLIFSLMAVSEIVPSSWENEFLQPNLVKVLPCFLVWCVIQWQLLSLRNRRELTVKVEKFRVAMPLAEVR